MANPFTGIGGAIRSGLRTFGEANYLRSMQDKYGPDWQHQMELRQAEEDRRRQAELRAAEQEKRVSQQANVTQTATLATLVANALEGQQDPTNYEGTLPPDFDQGASGLVPGPAPAAPVDLRALVSGFGTTAQVDLAVAAGTGMARQSKRQLAILAAERAAAGQDAAMERTRYGADRRAEEGRLRREAARDNLTRRLAQSDRQFAATFGQRDAHFNSTYERLRAQGTDDAEAKAIAQRITEGRQMRLAVERNNKMSPQEKVQAINDLNDIYGSPQDVYLPSTSVPPLGAPAPPARQPGPSQEPMVKYQGRVVPLSSLPPELQARVRAGR